MSMDLISSVSNSISIVRRLREISKNVTEAEFKNLLADLSNELADIKLEAAALKEQILTLEQENAVLSKTTSPSDEKPIGTKWGCYEFQDDDGLYCPACWDTKRQKCRTTRVTSKFRLCPACQAPIGS